MIYPADDPRVAVFSGHGLRLRIEQGAPESPGTIRLSMPQPNSFADGQMELVAPNGTRVEMIQSNAPLTIPPSTSQFMVRRLADQAPWVIGRAGMHYRDLIPDRLGGSIIASHIRIPDGGPVPDVVHYHEVGFQLIYCYRGWVDLVYEDQGPPFRLFAGDCVIQPPRIRHRVLFASDNIEVIEIGVPAEHITRIDHDMTLPNATFDPDRVFDGQRFVHNTSQNAQWDTHQIPGFVRRDTGIKEGTNGVADVLVVRSGQGGADWYTHNTEIHFTFVMEGSFMLETKDHPAQTLSAGDAFVVPPQFPIRYMHASQDLELLEVSLPAGC